MRAAQAEPAEQRDILDLLEMFGILDAHDDGAFFVRLGAIEIGRPIDQREHMAVAPGKALPPREEGQRLLLGIGAAQAVGVVKAGDATGAKLGGFGIGQPVRDIVLRQRDLERREHVDNER